jgi:hypothetical protein
MTRMGLLSCSCVAMLALSCVDRSQEQDLKPPRGFVPPPASPPKKLPLGPRTRYGEGFYPTESNAGGRWSWIGRRGELQIAPENGRPRLRVSGFFPSELAHTPPTIRISFEDRLLDTFVGDKGEFDKTYTVPPELLTDRPWTRVVIETSATTRAPGDARDLGVGVRTVEWESAD